MVDRKKERKGVDWDIREGVQWKAAKRKELCGTCTSAGLYLTEGATLSTCVNGTETPKEDTLIGSRAPELPDMGCWEYMNVPIQVHKAAPRPDPLHQVGRLELHAFLAHALLPCRPQD